MGKLVPLLFFAAVCAGLPAHAEWIKDVDISIETSGKDGEVHYTLKLAAGKTQSYDYLFFELFYHQTFHWVDARGKRTRRRHEPVSFKYRRSTVRLVVDLDHHISFRVPVDRQKLENIYGETTFNKDAPVTIERMTITGVAGGKTLWTYDIPARGQHHIPEIVAEQKAREKAERNKEEDLSDLTDIPDWLR